MHQLKTNLEVKFFLKERELVAFSRQVAIRRISQEITENQKKSVSELRNLPIFQETETLRVVETLSYVKLLLLIYLNDVIKTIKSIKLLINNV